MIAVDLLTRAFPLLVDALAMTIFLGVTSFLIGSAIGMVVALARLFGGPVLRAVAVTYVSILRGTPLLIQLLLVYFGLPQFGILLRPVPAAIIALSLHAGAYLAENFRAGILAVDKGQWEAAYSLGMPFAKAFRRVAFPQAARVAIPPVGSRFIALIKDTSLASVVTVVELTAVAESIGSSTFRYLEMFAIVAMIYWVINSLLSLGQEVLERRLARAY
ncbi:MAG: amino acid ABC transporter permease [Thermomicrobiales bacterium]|nr:amino acid ABC transporter permease [Thermomicrobiales bacterium]